MKGRFCLHVEGWQQFNVQEVRDSCADQHVLVAGVIRWGTHGHNRSLAGLQLTRPLSTARTPMSPFPKDRYTGMRQLVADRQLVPLHVRIEALTRIGKGTPSDDLDALQISEAVFVVGRRTQVSCSDARPPAAR